MATKKTTKSKPSKTVKAPKKVSTGKTPVLVTKKPAVIKNAEGTRLKKLTKRQQKQKSRVVDKQLQKQRTVPPAWKLLGQSLKHLYRYKKAFLGILVIYGVLYILFVKGISANFQLNNLRQSFTNTFSGKLSGFSTGVALFGLLLGTAGNTSSQTAGIYQLTFIVIVSLALIWALRTSYSGTIAKLRVRDSFYKGMTQLVPFMIVGLLVLIQTLPAIVVGSLYNVAQNSGIFVGFVQQALALIVLCLGLLWSFYMLSNSLFALYIVTLPNATPRASLKAAKKLVRFRRALVIRKVLFLPAVLLLGSALVLIPLILFFAPAAEVLFTLFTIAILAVVHSYFYTFYRSLLHE